MKLLAAVFLAAAVSAQSASICPGAPVLESCLMTTRAALAACEVDDFTCLCIQSKAIFACYASAGCEDDPASSGEENTFKAYCAHVPTSTASPISASTTTTSASAATENTDSTPTETATGTPTNTDSSEEANFNSGSDDSNSGGAYMVMNAGAVLAAVAGVITTML